MEKLQWAGVGSLMGAIVGASMHSVVRAKKIDTSSSNKIHLVDKQFTHIHDSDVLHELFLTITELQLVDKFAFHDLARSINDLEGMIKYLEINKDEMSAKQIIKANRMAAVAKHVMRFYKTNLTGRSRAIFDDNESRLNSTIGERLDNVIQTVSHSMTN